MTIRLRKAALQWLLLFCIIFPSFMFSHPATANIQNPSAVAEMPFEQCIFGFGKKKKSKKKKDSKKPKPLPPKDNYQYRLAIGTMFKNEAQWLKEWLEYHRLLGVEHFYLYNNDSSDNFLEVLEPYINAGIVELIVWDSKPETPWVDPGDKNPRFVGYQRTAFNDCIKRALHKVQWLGIMDIDEYLVPEHGIQSLYRHLDAAENKPGIGSLKFYWKCYGTSYVWDIPKDRLMTEMLVLRTEDSFLPNTYLTKCLHRPEAVAYCEVHNARMSPGFREAYISDVRINHYQLRGRKNTLLIRCGTVVNSEEELSTVNADAQGCLNYHEELYNRIEDRTIEQYLTELKKMMSL